MSYPFASNPPRVSNHPAHAPGRPTVDVSNKKNSRTSPLGSVYFLYVRFLQSESNFWSSLLSSVKQHHLSLEASMQAAPALAHLTRSFNVRSPAAFVREEMWSRHINTSSSSGNIHARNSGDIHARDVSPGALLT
jgi:hypothetical protein